MPIYEYTCKKCGKTIEVIQKFSDPALKKHEKCGGTLTKLISAAGFQFKGSGWYVTDYARKPDAGKTEGAVDKPAQKESEVKTKPAKEAGAGETSSKAKSDHSNGSRKSSDS